MQAIVIAACSVLFVIVDFVQAQDDISNSLYTKRYERLDIDTILASPRLVTNYVECLLNKKPCAPEGKALKRVLPEALRTKCSRCHPSQKEVALKVITALYFDYPQHYKDLREKWDPSGEYNKRFEEYLRDQKFNSIGGSDAEPGEQAQRPTRQGEGQNASQPQAQGQGQGSQAQESKPSPTTTVPDDKELPSILNRFGGDDEDGYDYSGPSSPNKTNNPPAPPVVVAQPKPSPPPTQRPTPLKPVAPPAPLPTAQAAPSRRPPSNGHTNSRPSHNSGSNPSHTGTHYHHYQPPNFSTTTTYYLNTQNPVLNIISRITQKWANTAEFIAGMLRGAVPQPQAPKQNTKQQDDILRKFCERLRKTLSPYTNSNQKNYQLKIY